MVVTREQIFGTIGGGNLEYRATELARKMIADGSSKTEVHEFPLGPSLGQCCGGHTTVLVEIVEARPTWLQTLHDRRVGGSVVTLVTEISTGDKHVVTADSDGTAPDLIAKGVRQVLAEGAFGTHYDADRDFLVESIGDYGTEVWIFGAGHVGRAIVNILAPLADLRITWVDSRPDQFPGQAPENVRIVESDDPVAELAALPSGAYVLVMTHSHGTDYDIVETVLRRGDFRYLGLIGSATKRARFEQRWRHRGGAETALSRLVSPIGLDGIDGKEPAVIAIAVAAEIQQLRERTVAATAVRGLLA